MDFGMGNGKNPGQMCDIGEIASFIRGIPDISVESQHLSAKSSIYQRNRMIYQEILIYQRNRVIYQRNFKYISEMLIHNYEFFSSQ
ncbi:hypothetical protein [Rossellomorea sp. FM04394]|uniref:hypothetical protein n=1 Tax=Rossellomorea sp. FM04394 TaxID=3243076 RepID=UPI0035A6E38F